MKSKNIYLDGAANAPLDKKVFKAMKPYLVGYKGNSMSLHPEGVNSYRVVENARKQVLSALGGNEDDFQVYFTSGATESNNWVIQSLCRHELENHKDKHKGIYVYDSEHSSVLNTCKEMEKIGIPCVLLESPKQGQNSNDRGTVTIPEVLRKTHGNVSPLLCCIMAVNNETGAENNPVIINYIADIIHDLGGNLLVDCTQALGYGGNDFKILQKYSHADYFSFSGHKIYGPTGTGCLIRRKSAPLYPFIIGGEQEEALRGGTHNIAGIVGIAAACKLMAENDYSVHYEKLYEHLEAGLLKLDHKNGIVINVNVIPSKKNIINLQCKGYLNTKRNLNHFHLEQAANNLINLGISCSSGSACHESDEDPQPSHVLLNLGMKKSEIQNSFRISFTKYTTKKDIDKLMTALSILVKNLNNSQIHKKDKDNEH